MLTCTNSTHTYSAVFYRHPHISSHVREHTHTQLELSSTGTHTHKETEPRSPAGAQDEASPLAGQPQESSFPSSSWPQGPHLVQRHQVLCSVSCHYTDNLHSGTHTWSCHILSCLTTFSPITNSFSTHKNEKVKSAQPSCPATLWGPSDSHNLASGQLPSWPTP